jgi:hypothetical protein
MGLTMPCFARVSIVCVFSAGGVGGGGSTCAVGVGERGAEEPGMGELSAGEQGAGELNAGELGAGELSTGEPCIGEVGACMWGCTTMFGWVGRDTGSTCSVLVRSRRKSRSAAWVVEVQLNGKWFSSKIT